MCAFSADTFLKNYTKGTLRLMNINSKKLVYFLVISLICGLVVGEAAHANIIKITGKVHADGTPIVDVIVAAPDFGDIPITDTTGENGSYSIPYISFGNVVIQVGDKILVQFTDVNGNFVIERTHTVTAADISAGEATFNINVSVNIPDANLRATFWWKTSGVPITLWDMATLTELDATNISNLTGLEHATNLTALYLGYNSISDISPLSGLTNLRTLFLNDNNISDISPLVSNTGLGDNSFVDVRGNPLNAVSINTHIPTLQSRGVTVEFDLPQTTVNIPDANLRAAIESALGKASGATITATDMAGLAGLNASNANISDLTGLEYATSLTYLNLDDNEIVEISPLLGLTDLTHLSLGGNSISDISAVSGLTNLTDLFLTDNEIVDIWPLEGLTDLTRLDLSNNSISDISPLVSNTGLGDNSFVDVRGNPLNAVSINTHIPTLQSRGVTVEFDLPQTSGEYPRREPPRCN